MLLLHSVGGILTCKLQRCYTHADVACRLGKVVQLPDHEDYVMGLYACGWVKRGPSGIIGMLLCLVMI